MIFARGVAYALATYAGMSAHESDKISGVIAYSIISVVVFVGTAAWSLVQKINIHGHAVADTVDALRPGSGKMIVLDESGKGSIINKQA